MNMQIRDIIEIVALVLADCFAVWFIINDNMARKQALEEHAKREINELEN